MSELIVLSSTVLGFTASVITELLKLIPWFNTTKTRKRALALVVSFVMTAVYALTSNALNGVDTVGALLLVVMSSFSTYQAIIKTFVEE